MKTKRKPTLPGEILEEHYIKPLSLSKSAFAEALGIARSTLYKILDGRARITAYIAIRLAKSLNTSVEMWLNLQQKTDIWEAEHDRSFANETGNIRPIVELVAHSR